MYRLHLNVIPRILVGTVTDVDERVGRGLEKHIFVHEDFIFSD